MGCDESRIAEPTPEAPRPLSRVEGDVGGRRGAPPNDRATMSTATVRVTATTVRETRASWKRSFQTRVTRTRPTMGSEPHRRRDARGWERQAEEASQRE